MFIAWKSPWVLSIRNEKVLHQSHIIVKFQYAGNKEKFLKASKRFGAGKEEVTYKRRTFEDFSTATLGTRRHCNNDLNILWENHFQPSMLFPTKIVIKKKIKYQSNESRINIFRHTSSQKFCFLYTLSQEGIEIS